MADEMSLNEAMDVARQMRNHFRAFERLDALLLGCAEKQQAAAEAEKRKDLTLAGIPAIQDRINQLMKEHEVQKEKLDTEFRSRQEGYERVLAQVKKETDVKLEEGQQRLAMIQKNVEDRIARIQQEVEIREREASEEIVVIQNRANIAAAELHAKIQAMTNNYNIQEEEYADRMRSFAKDEAEAGRKIAALREEWETTQNRVSKLLSGGF